MTEVDPNLMLASARGPVYEPEAVAQGRALTLQNAVQANQKGAQDLAGGAIDLQQKQIGLADQQKIADLYLKRAAAAGNPAPAGTQPSTGGMIDGDFINQAAQAGVSGKGLNDLVQTHLKQMETKSIADKNAAEASHFGVETQKIKTQVAGQSANAVLQLPPEQRAAGWTRARADLIAGGYATPDQIDEAYPGDAVLQQHSDAAIEAEKQQAMKIKANEEARAAALAPFLLNQASAKAAGENLALRGQTLGGATNQTEWTAAIAKLPQDEQAAVNPMFSPDEALRARAAGLTADQQTTAAQATANAAATKARDANTVVNDAALRKQGAQRLGIEGARLNLEREKSGFDMNGGVSLTAKAIANAELDPLTTRALIRRSPGLIGQVKAILPTWDEADIENRFNTLREFTNTSVGKAGGQLIAANTMIHHADLYMETADALRNGSFKPGNAIYNKVADAFGAAPPTNAALVGRFLAGETGKLATGGVPAEGELKGMLEHLGTNAGPDQIAGAGKILLRIGAGRVTPLMERAQKAHIENNVQLLGPDAKAILAKRGFNPDTMKLATGGAAGGLTVTDPTGGVHTFKTQAAADAFKVAAGIK